MSAGSTCRRSGSQILTPQFPPHPQAQGPDQTQQVFPQEMPARPILAGDTETHVQGQEKVLWTANVSQAPGCLPSPRDLPTSEERGLDLPGAFQSQIRVPGSREPRPRPERTRGVSCGLKS